MLYDLGLRRYPPIDVLLSLAAGPEPTNRLAFDYLLENIHTHYAGFDPSTFGGVAFIPATSATGNNTLAKPGEVFTNESCRILGFSVARLPASLLANAAKLGIASDPSMPQLVAAFLAGPERDPQRARSVFEVGRCELSLLTVVLGFQTRQCTSRSHCSTEDNVLDPS